jgi:ABC-type polysaccharide/polyol phosphate export permease
VSDTIFERIKIAPFRALYVPDHYVLSFLLFFLLLALVVLYPIYSMDTQTDFLKRLLPYMSWHVLPLSQILTVAIVWSVLIFSLLLCVCIFGNGLILHLLLLIPQILLIGLFCSVFGWICCNIGQIFGANLLIFILSSVWMLASGGIVPIPLLPRPIQKLAPWSPITWMREILSPLYGVSAQSSSWIFFLIGLFGCLLLAFVLSWRLRANVLKQGVAD